MEAESVVAESVDSISHSSDQSMACFSSDSNIETQICLVGDVAHNKDVISALKEIHAPFLTSKDGLEYAKNEDPNYETVFVLDEFQGNVFNDLKALDIRIIGPPIIQIVSKTKEPIPFTHRPLYCTCMHNLNLCFSNFKSATHVNRLVSLCHFMGASVRKEMTTRIDFLITNTPHGPKYRRAVNLGVQVVKEDWVHVAWEARNSKEPYRANADEFVQASKIKTFEACVISFLGFSDEDCKHMQEQAIQQGGKVDEVGSKHCTHVVVDNGVKVLPENVDKVFMVTQEWFWESIQIEARGAESLYLFKLPDNQNHVMTRSQTWSTLPRGTPTRNGSKLLATSLSVKRRYRTRKREETLAKLAENVDSNSIQQPEQLLKETSACIDESLLDISNTPTALRSPKVTENSRKRYAPGIGDEYLSLSGRKRKIDECEDNSLRKRRLTIASSVCDAPQNQRNRRYSAVPQLESFPEENQVIVNQQETTVTARYQVVRELLQTETNYIGVLSTIINLFKKPLENPAQAKGAILPMEDIKSIFGSIEEIHSVHQKMTRDLNNVLNSWNANSCVGTVVKKYAPEFVRCYPAFVNFFDSGKQTITSCETKYPRFHAFLKLNQAKKECGRQTLAELLINPVQRLPRIILLLQDIKKHTERENSNHPDVNGIMQCLDAVKEVMTHINEDRRKTESRKQIFDIVYEVEDCPPTIVSSHRQFITRAEAISVDDNLCPKGEHLCLILFTDCIEIAKRKKGMKSHGVRGSPRLHTNSPNMRSLKHVKLMSLAHVKMVVDIKNSEDCQSAFALYCRTPTETKNWLYTFRMVSCQATGQEGANGGVLPSEEGKSYLLKLLARYHANTVCKASDDNFIYNVHSHELDVSTADIVSTFGRAVRAAKKSRKKLTKAFSFSRTPHRVVQRAMSNVMTPSPMKIKAIAVAQHNTPGGCSKTDWDDSENEDTISISSGMGREGLTPSMSVTSLCAAKQARMESTLSLQTQDQNRTLKNSTSVMSVRKPAYPTSEFPAMPTPPIRRKKNPIKAATIALGRSASFRRKNRLETKL